MNHTTTPWHVRTAVVTDSFGDLPVTFIEPHPSEEAHGERIAVMGGYVEYRDEANAAHIVKCVNAHDELVAALRDAVIALESLGEEGTQLDTLRAALVKVDA